MNKQDIVDSILSKTKPTIKSVGCAFAPSNIALVKYWGKSNTELNIPYTDSLSISLGELGAKTSIEVINNKLNCDIIILNGKEVEAGTNFYQRASDYLDLFRLCHKNNNKIYYKVTTDLNIPVAAGVASSACGFAALALALDDLYSWSLSKQNLSILARLGSGSASRSLWDGFVYWQKGEDINGQDCYSYLINADESIKNNLCIGLVIVSCQQKKLSSRQAMLDTVETSVLYQAGWASQVERDISLVKKALSIGDFDLLGETAENNSMAMHATMLSAKPAICYSTTKTIEVMQKVWKLREQGIKVYFTQDAGPNLKLLFSSTNMAIIKDSFDDLTIVRPFI